MIAQTMSRGRLPVLKLLILFSRAQPTRRNEAAPTAASPMPFMARIAGERSANLKKAIAGYEAALGVLTRSAFPRDHMQTARLLAGASLPGR